MVRRAMVGIFGSSVELAIERTEHGRVAVVYRVERGDETFFLRLGKEEVENLEVDALLHERLGQAGVLVPAVVHVEAFNDGLRRSIMVTRHIGGNPVAETPDPVLAAAIVKQAGHDLAVINQFAVEGFGSVRRREPELGFVAELADYPSFVTHDLPDPWPGKFGELFSDSDLAQIEVLIGHERARPIPRASLAHGDLGLNHIFERDGVYTGIIDFGEIRGTEPEFDLGVFYAQTPRENRALLVESIMAGYSTVSACLTTPWPAYEPPRC